MSQHKRKRSQKRRSNLGRMETSDWERGPDEIEFTSEELAQQDRATGWVMAIGAGLLLLVVLKKA